MELEHSTNNLHPLWFAVMTRSRHEKVVRDQLARRGIEELLPSVRRISQWTDRKKEIQSPLFPGYCFARFSWQNRMTVLELTGVVSIVGQAGSPEPILDAEINAIKTILSSRCRYDVYPDLSEGDPVEVIRGPFQGLSGNLIRKANHARLVIAVHVIRQGAAVEIDEADVVPITETGEMR